MNAETKNRIQGFANNPKATRKGGEYSGSSSEQGSRRSTHGGRGGNLTNKDRSKGGRHSHKNK